MPTAVRAKKIFSTRKKREVCCFGGEAEKAFWRGEKN
jgi:hypothetical protein